MSAGLSSTDLAELGEFINALDTASNKTGFYIDMTGVEICTVDNDSVGILTWDNDAEHYNIKVQP